MNEKLMGFLLRSEIGKIAEEKRKLYQFIVDEENQLALRADTADQFLQLLATHSPYELASYHFNLPSEKVFRLMNKIEAELNERIQARYKKVKWIDYTNHSKQTNFGDHKKYVFLFVN
ncbi:hypothetical protein [Paenisporosarcina sp. OV554]|uniref:hypothetical protein n=1 Tax=Paenisporosarcina sp. OV554 TaxID=2135694 RepID=UPI000D3C22DF|nr:hypothetical protein [Paenisporosarcina sp. OV554]PUB14038.1 hypothetical protein C8K15_106192 [Paenisporosarcina sp. OV554]